MSIANPLEPLYKPWDPPTRRREKNPAGGPALNVPGRRQSRALLVPHIRVMVDMWRSSGYPDVSDTTRTLLHHWFDTAHEDDFRYHFCQQEAVETVIWLYEVAKYRRLSDMVSSLIPPDDARLDRLVAGIADEDDAWARYCSKVATGGGKTKCMSLIIAWSYFNSMYEDAVRYPRHFVLIAPNLIVFDRLLDDFAGSPSVFYRDPVIPPEFGGDFNLDVIQQDEAGGATSTGALYVTNIHRLFERERSPSRPAPPAWAGPDVARAQVFKSGEKLRSRITDHPGVMVLNDEAHHLHDPGSAWNDAVRAIHDQSKTKGNAGVQMQIDLTATPKHNDGSLFRHIVSDFPLGEAVNAGIVKVPVIGRSKDLTPFPAVADAFEEYRNHLLLGYQQYAASFEEWKETRKPVLFVMTEDATKANEIAAKLNNDDRFPLLKGRVLNLHTRLKGDIKKRTMGGKTFLEFEPGEKKISDEDLKALRELSKQLDSTDSPFRCVVSVLMLREGWDVRNVTTIVPLRPYSAESNILAEQTLGRGLRRMTKPGETLERVTVVEQAAFERFYQQELEQEGLDIAAEDLQVRKPETVSIFVDHRNKPVPSLELEIPLVTDSITATTTIEGLVFEDVATNFTRRFKPLPVQGKTPGNIHFEERTLFTDEVVSRYELDRGLLKLGATAISVFVRDLEMACRVRGANAVLAPMIQRFIEEVLFDRKVSVYGGQVDHRMGDVDVLEHIRATFTPLIRKKTITTHKREAHHAARMVSGWQNFQATNSQVRPCIRAEKTMFNLVPCDHGFEEEFTSYLDHCDDLAAFVKNAGPQKLMVDYIGVGGRPALYWPDFMLRTVRDGCVLVELKGAQDAAAALKAQAAIEWCKAASTTGIQWAYLYLTMPVFHDCSDFSVASLMRASAPALRKLLESLKTQQLELPLDQTPAETRKERADSFLGGLDLQGVPAGVQLGIQQAINQLDFDKRIGNRTYQLAFSALLQDLEFLCGEILVRSLGPRTPQIHDDRRYYFDPYLSNLPNRLMDEMRRQGLNLRRNVTEGAYNNRIGNLLFCLRFAREQANAQASVGGVWTDVISIFAAPGLQQVSTVLADMYSFRNEFVAHGETPLTDYEMARTTLTKWINGLVALSGVASV